MIVNCRFAIANFRFMKDEVRSEASVGTGTVYPNALTTKDTKGHNGFSIFNCQFPI